MKFCGIPVGILWISYNIYIKSVFGILLESVLLVASSVGYILEFRKNKKGE
ncbi:MAG: YgjV family protein [Clostridia bacterium]